MLQTTRRPNWPFPAAIKLRFVTVALLVSMLLVQGCMAPPIALSMINRTGGVEEVTVVFERADGGGPQPTRRSVVLQPGGQEQFRLGLEPGLYRVSATAGNRSAEEHLTVGGGVEILGGSPQRYVEVSVEASRITISIGMP